MSEVTTPATNEAVEYELSWDDTAERWFGNGVSHGVLYPMKDDGTYDDGVAWNGLTGVDENPDGGDTTDLWADNIKYASFRNPENYGGTIKAYTYPDEFAPCDGMKIVDGVTFGGQKRKPFGFCYRTELDNDTGTGGYIIHVVYNSTVSPTSKSHNTKNENPDAEEMSWDYKSTPVTVTGITGIETTCTMEFSTRLLTADQMTAVEKLLYGYNNTDPALPSPDTLHAAVVAAAGT